VDVFVVRDNEARFFYEHLGFKEQTQWTLYRKEPRRSSALCHASGKKFADALFAHNRRGGCLISALDCLRLARVPDESLQVDFSPVTINDDSAFSGLWSMYRSIIQGG
jgi:hypothetical protein